MNKNSTLLCSEYLIKRTTMQGLEGVFYLASILPNYLAKRLDLFQNKSDILDKKSDVLDKKSNILDKKSDILAKKSNNLDKKFNNLDKKFNILDKKSDILSKLLDFLAPFSAILDNKFKLLRYLSVYYPKLSFCLNGLGGFQKKFLNKF